jgi:hypothetical protein
MEFVFAAHRHTFILSKIMYYVKTSYAYIRPTIANRRVRESLWIEDDCNWLVDL